MVQPLLHKTGTNDSLFQGLFGLEIEEHRVQISRSSLSQLAHSAKFGDRSFHPYFQTDFSESQEELVTAPHKTSQAALQQLHELQTILTSHLTDDEIIWPLSMPPHLAADDLNFLANHFERTWYQAYRDFLIKGYGYYQHIMTGVHINFSISNALVDQYQRTNQIADSGQAKNQLYFKIAQHIVAYRWFLTYLFGASPVSENPDDTIPSQKRSLQPVRSWRASQYGFKNQPNIQIGYASLTEHLQQLAHALNINLLYDRSEFYGPVRFKNAGTIAALKQNGPDYLEFRMFDINPFSLDGISQEALSLLHLLIIDALNQGQTWTASELIAADEFNNEVALAHPQQALNDELQQQAKILLIRLQAITQQAPASLKTEFEQAIKYAKSALTTPTKTVAGQLVNYIENDSLVAFALEEGQNWRSQHQIALNQFQSVNENLVSTYIQALTLGFKTEVQTLDQLKLSYQGKSWLINEPLDLKTLLQQ
ncbi:glutamate--cysteine ligase [Convivina intestini]|uniref:glutamate--cysteine ligase n=1 Tax=Convivina intestini TaxID=1505726 RepID=UPI00200F8553|nr:glutamate--cysteine ligase [Convivina intestini]CAH1856687.1 Glutathione biosynthesis bifunctional protein GshAB [Convivina intestini]